MLLSQIGMRVLAGLAFVICGGLSPARAQLNGALSGSLGPGHFTVTGNIALNAGDTLRIQPGTTLQFVGLFRFDVNGTLLAQGTVADSIVFTCDTVAVAARWRKVRFNGATSTGSVLEYCVIENSATPNTFPQFNGGGVYCSSASPYFRSCSFRNNIANQAGGGVYCSGGAAVFEECEFTGNSSGAGGGGLALQSSAHAIIERCLFAGNAAISGGGIAVQTSSNPVVSYSTLVGNFATQNGGAVYSFGTSPAFYDCHVRYNHAATQGAAASIYSGAPVWDHCSIAYNTTAASGASLHITTSAAVVSNSLLCFSEQAGLFFDGSSGAQCSYNCIAEHAGGNFLFDAGNPGEGPAGIGVLVQRNVNRDSCDAYFNIFVNPQIADTVAGIYEPLICSSPLIGAANPAAPAGSDIRGHVRPDPVGSVVDIGGFESEQSHPGIKGLLRETYGPGLYVICDTISLMNPDSARLLPGTRFEFAGAVPFNITGRLLAEGTTDDSIYFITDTLLNSARWRGLRFTNQNSSGSRLSYCVINNSLATGSGNARDGGAIFCTANSSPQFFDCSIEKCRSDNYGGAAYVSNSSPQFTRCEFVGHRAVERGGAVYLNNSSAIFTFCVFQGNRADQQPGGTMYITGGSPQLIRSTICEGSAVQQGGGVHLNATTALFNSTIISHCTGAGFYFRSSPNAQVRYCDGFGNSGGNFVLHNNAASNGPAGIGQKVTVNVNGDSADVFYNLQGDPLYVNRAGFDLHLTEPSLCIDAGDVLLAHDPDATVADIGAYFFSQAELSVDSLVIEYGGGVAELSWHSLSAQFHVYGSPTFDGTGTLLGTVNEPQWTDSLALTRGLMYYYWVTAFEP